MGGTTSRSNILSIQHLPGRPMGFRTLQSSGVVEPQPSSYVWTKSQTISRSSSFCQPSSILSQPPSFDGSTPFNRTLSLPPFLRLPCFFMFGSLQAGFCTIPLRSRLHCIGVCAFDLYGFTFHWRSQLVTTYSNCLVVQNVPHGPGSGWRCILIVLREAVCYLNSHQAGGNFGGFGTSFPGFFWLFICLQHSDWRGMFLHIHRMGRTSTTESLV